MYTVELVSSAGFTYRLDRLKPVTSKFSVVCIGQSD
jgi:hypothetical protein